MVDHRLHNVLIADRRARRGLGERGPGDDPLLDDVLVGSGRLGAGKGHGVTGLGLGRPHAVPQLGLLGFAGGDVGVGPRAGGDQDVAFQDVVRRHLELHAVATVTVLAQDAGGLVGELLRGISRGLGGRGLVGNLPEKHRREQGQASDRSKVHCRKGSAKRGRQEQLQSDNEWRASVFPDTAKTVDLARKVFGLDGLVVSNRDGRLGFAEEVVNPLERLVDRLADRGCQVVLGWNEWLFARRHRRSLWARRPRMSP